MKDSFEILVKFNQNLIWCQNYPKAAEQTFSNVYLFNQSKTKINIIIIILGSTFSSNDFK